MTAFFTALDLAVKAAVLAGLAYGLYQLAGMYLLAIFEGVDR